MEYSKEDLMEAKKQIWGVGENMGTEESKKGAADIFLEIITQPFLGFDGIVPGSSNQATV